MLEPYDTFPPTDPVAKFEAEVTGLQHRRKKRHVAFRAMMVFVWLLAIAIGFGLGAFWKH